MTSPHPAALIGGVLGPSAYLVNRHQVAVAAQPDRAYGAALSVSLRELPMVRLLFTLRGIRYKKDMTVREFFTTSPFRLLKEDPPREVVFGIEGGGIRAVGNFRVLAASSGSLLTTETWVEPFSPLARRRFRIYWAAIGPFSGLIRRILLRAAKRRAEAG